MAFVELFQGSLRENIIMRSKISNAKLIRLIALILILGGFGWFLASFPAGEKQKGEKTVSQQEEGAPPASSRPLEESEEELQSSATGQKGVSQTKLFGITARVTSVNPEENSLVINGSLDEGEFIVLITEGVRITRLEFPFDPANPPEEGVFTPTETLITLEELQEGNQVFVLSSESFAGKKEIRNIEFIRILP